MHGELLLKEEQRSSWRLPQKAEEEKMVQNGEEKVEEEKMVQISEKKYKQWLRMEEELEEEKLVQILEKKDKHLLKMEEELQHIKLVTSGQTGCVVGNYKGKMYTSPLSYTETLNHRIWWKLEEVANSAAKRGFLCSYLADFLVCVYQTLARRLNSTVSRGGEP